MRLPISRFRRIDDNYKIHERIWSSNFGDVYRVTARNRVQYAAKIVSNEHLQFLNNERAVMRRANHSQRLQGTQSWYYFGRHGPSLVLVMDLLGESIRTLERNYTRLCLKSVLLIGIQLTKRIEALHARGYIHRNITPENLVIGKVGEDRKCFHLTEYSLARQFRDSNGVSQMFTMGTEWHGSKIFASRQAHRRLPESWRSDLESAIYLIIHLLRRLPWDRTPELDSTSTVLMKESATDDVLCRGLPIGIRKYYRDVMRLSYLEQPDYDKLSSYLEESLHRYMCTDDEFEWTRGR